MNCRTEEMSNFYFQKKKRIAQQNLQVDGNDFSWENALYSVGTVKVNISCLWMIISFPEFENWRGKAFYFEAKKWRKCSIWGLNEPLNGTVAMRAPRLFDLITSNRNAFHQSLSFLFWKADVSFKFFQNYRKSSIFVLIYQIFVA